MQFHEIFAVKINTYDYFFCWNQNIIIKKTSPVLTPIWLFYPFTSIDDGEFEENERKLQQLEYQQQNGLHQNNKNNLVHENNKKNNDPEKTSANNGGGIPTTKTESSTINNGTIKVAIATEISMANMMASMNQCK